MRNTCFTTATYLSQVRQEGTSAFHSTADKSLAESISALSTLIEWLSMRPNSGRIFIHCFPKSGILFGGHTKAEVKRNGEKRDGSSGLDAHEAKKRSAACSRDSGKGEARKSTGETHYSRNRRSRAEGLSQSERGRFCGGSQTMKQKTQTEKREKPIPDVYPVIDNDLARDNMENDLPEADKEDL